MNKSNFNIQEVIKEHEKRKKALFVDYNPITGSGSRLRREVSKIDGLEDILFTLEFKNDSLFNLIERLGWQGACYDLNKNQIEAEAVDVEELRLIFHQVRCSYDFEYWCATSATIKDGLGKKIKFILNPPQRISLVGLEEMRNSGVPVRDIEVKHRQYGSTTMKNAYIFWIQNVVHNGYSAYVCSLDQTGATKIVSRYEVIVDNYPEALGELNLKRFMGLKNTYEVPETNSLINIGSAQNPNAPSGDTIQCALISEAGKMKSTDEKGADKLMTNIVSMVRMEANTFILIESTAEQSGAWFRSQAFKAQRNDSAFHLTFISWLTDYYRCSVEVLEGEYESLIKSMNEYHWFLWKLGATLDQINWYQKKEGEYDNDWQMKQENPTTIDEAFEGAGKKIFTPDQITTVRQSVKEPIFTGEIVNKDGYTSGEECLTSLEFEANPKGRLQVWKYPRDPAPDDGKYMLHRYCLYVDIGGTTPESDYSVVSVGDRYWQAFGGGPERCAMWRGHCDPDELAWISAQIGMMYEEGLMAVEVNSLYSRGNNTDGVHYLKIFQEITEHYNNVFTRSTSEDVKERFSKYGFLMNKATKNLLVDSFRQSLRTNNWVERSDIVANETSYFIKHDDGTIGAMSGEHDDALIGAMGVNWLAVDYMDAPRFINKPNPDYLKRKKGSNKSEAVI